MGHQVATLCAIKGFRTFCTDTDKQTLDKAADFFSTYIASRVEKKKLTVEEAERIKERLSFTQELEEAVGSADFVIEAVVELLDVKRDLFSRIDKLAPRHAIISTNSSYIVSSKLADVTRRPDKVCNMHFFNPALVMKLVEVVKGPHVSEETARIAYQLSEKLDKVPVTLNREVEGLLMNRIVMAVRLEAYWLIDMGIASVEDIDKACVYGAGHPMGPFQMNDLSGLDLSYMHLIEKFRETGDPADAPPPCLAEKYFQGKFGRKTGEGWYKYK